MAKVYDVTDVRLSFNKTRPPEFVVAADGRTRTGGYTSPTLTRRIYIDQPQDGVQDYDFEAVPPSGMATQQLTPITARDVWPDPPSWLRGARVYAETNSKEKLLGSA